MLNKKTLTAVVLALAATVSHAHSDRQHARKAFDAAEAEQKEFGIAGDPKKATRTIRLVMNDRMRFAPGKIDVREGEVVKFIIVNKGRMLHEMVLGTTEELKEHAELMKKFPDMEHDEPHMAHVEPGKSEQLVWKFNKAGEFAFACLMPGHFEAGMSGTVIVRRK